MAGRVWQHEGAELSEALQVAEITIVDVRVAQVEVFDVAELPKLREMRLLEGAAADRGR